MDDLLPFIGWCVIVMGLFAIGAAICEWLDRYETAKYHRGWRP